MGRRHGLLVLLLDARVDNVGVGLGGRVEDEVDARLDLDRSLSLGLSLLLLVAGSLVHRMLLRLGRGLRVLVLASCDRVGGVVARTRGFAVARLRLLDMVR